MATALVPTSASAQSERSIVAAMRAIEADWKRGARDQRWFLTHCAEGTYAQRRLARGPVISVDVQRTQSVMSPYIGIIEIVSSLETNSSSPRASGFLSRDAIGDPRVVFYKSMEEARLAASPADVAAYNSGLVYRMRAEYEVVGAKLVLRRGNAVFFNAIGRSISLPENARRWSRTIEHSLR